MSHPLATTKSQTNLLGFEITFYPALVVLSGLLRFRLIESLQIMKQLKHYRLIPLNEW